MYQVKISSAFVEGRAFIERYGVVGAVKPRTMCHAPLDAIDTLISECPHAVISAPVALGDHAVEEVAENKPETIVEDDSVEDEPEAKACAATTKAGSPCKGKAYGGDYCNFHS